MVIDTNLHGNINRETKTYHAFRHPEHFFIKFQSFGISNYVLEILRREGVETILFTYYGKTGTRVYRVNLKKFLESHKTFLDRGVDLQKHVSIIDMSEV